MRPEQERRPTVHSTAHRVAAQEVRAMRPEQERRPTVRSTAHRVAAQEVRP
jgi:hypothetical protein